jgi:hypothetical protein
VVLASYHGGAPKEKGGGMERRIYKQFRCDSSTNALQNKVETPQQRRK